MKIELMESIINKAVKMIRGKSRKTQLISKINTKLDNMQKAKGMTPGKLKDSDFKALLKDKIYNSTSRKLTSVKWGDDIPVVKRKYLSGKKK